MSIEHVIGLAISGLTVGMIYALIALGYTMVYGVLEFINFAHGEVFTVGGYVMTASLLGLGVSDKTSSVWFWSLLVGSATAAVVATTALGWLVERIAYRPLRGRPRLIPLLSAIGVSIVLQQLILLIFGGAPIVVPTLGITAASVTVFGARVRVLALMIIGISIVLMIALTWLVKGTRIGKAMRATSQDMEAAEMMGINTNRTIAFTFVVGSALAGFGGVLVALYYGSLKYSDGFLYGLKAFTAAVLGGIGNIPGAVLGSLLLGVAENFGVGLDLGFLAWFFVAGLVAGLFVQFIVAPRRRVEHIAVQARTEKYVREVYKIYWFAPYLAVKRVLSPRTDALLSVSSRHAIRLLAGNLLLAAMAGVFFANSTARFAAKWQPVIAFVALVFVLVFRPTGILGEHVAEKV